MNIVAQCCGMVLMLVILFFYHGKRKLKLNTSLLYRLTWDIVSLSLILDVTSIWGITYADKLPAMFVEVLCKAYLWSIVLEALGALMYVCVDVYKSKELEKRWTIGAILAGIFCTIVIYSLPIYLYNSSSKMYTYGPSVIATYVLAAIILVVILGLVARYRKAIHPARRRGVLAWGILWMIAATIQFFNNHLLLVSFASVVGMVIIFISLENPDTNLDKDTGLFNLNGLFSYMRQLQGMGQDVSVLCVKYDNNRNGSMSYDTEKALMMQIVNFIFEIPNSIVFRSSATEFLLVFEKKEDAKAAIARIEDRFERPWGDVEYRMIPIDWALIVTTERIERAEDILPLFQYVRQNRANLGTDAGVIVDNELIAKIYEERNMENEIVEALRKDRVEVFYQPIYSVKGGGFSTAEALVRIRNEEGSLIPPGKFIEVAEKRGLIIKLGERVFESVCKFIVEENPLQYGIEYIEVNLSIVQCGYEKLADDFIEIMERYNVDPKKIVLEITESASIKRKNILLDNMKKLKAKGVRFALDDFGTGQSNLNYIVEMPVDVVKFDSTMTNAYFEDEKAKYVMDAAMQMIQGMDLEIVSEGIEEHNQYHEMKRLGIDYIQGFYFSKPINSEDFIELLKESKPNSDS